MKAQKKKALSVILLLTVLVSAGSQAVPAFAVDADGTALSNTTDDALTLPGERIYQIMTDRFYDGDPTNNATGEALRYQEITSVRRQCQ